jgi:hypothetical protein
MSYDDYQRHCTVITAADVIEPSRVSLADVWKTFDEDFVGLKEVRACFRRIENAERRASEEGKLLDSTYNFILQGKPRTGKSTVADKLITVPFLECAKNTSGDLQARFVGHLRRCARYFHQRFWKNSFHL